jgi:hypothetical protein
MINVKEYNKIKAVGATLAECLNNYTASLQNSGILVDEVAPPAGDVKTVAGAVRELRSQVVAGNTVYYLRLAGDARLFSVSAAANELIVAVNLTDAVTLTFDAKNAEAAVVPVTGFSFTPAPPPQTTAVPLS